MTVKISALPALTSATPATDVVPVNVSGTTSKMTLTNFLKSLVAPGTLGNIMASDGTYWVSQALTATQVSTPIINASTDSSSATPTPTGNYLRNFYTLTALAEGATFAAPSGTPANGNMLLVRIKDDGTARSLAYNAIYRAVGVTLKTTTTISKTQYFMAVYNSADSKWDVIAVGEEA